jgi:citrate lyase gamma subunit
MMNGAFPRAFLTVIAMTVSSGCAAPSVEPVRPSPTPTVQEELLVPPGYGTLRQEEITLSLQSGDLQIKVTPLDETIVRLTAPDTYQRLHSLARSRSTEIEAQSLRRDPRLFLVSFFSYAPNVTYQPEDLNLLNLGLRYRPSAIVPITPGWRIQRLDQQETQMAIYAFDPRIDLETDLEVEYREVIESGWDRILARVEAERARVRVRATRR